MRRVFLHIDEFRAAGMTYFPYLACVSEPLDAMEPFPSSA